MSRPPRSFYLLVLMAEVAGIVALAGAVSVLAWRRFGADPTQGLLHPQGSLRPVATADPPRTAPTTTTAPVEAQGPVSVPASASATSSQPARVPAPAGTVPCEAAWQPTAPTPTGLCALPDGGVWAPDTGGIVLACTDGSHLVAGAPIDQLLAGRVGGRLDALDMDQLAELAAQCQGG